MLAELFCVSKVHLWEVAGAKYQMFVYKAANPPIINLKYED